jgi:hypothetical protein
MNATFDFFSDLSYHSTHIESADPADSDADDTKHISLNLHGLVITPFTVSPPLVNSFALSFHQFPPFLEAAFTGINSSRASPA